MKYRDYIGAEFDDIGDLADFRINNSAPLLGGAECPAMEYNFSVSEDGTNWRKPNTVELTALMFRIKAHSGCCQNLGVNCPV